MTEHLYNATVYDRSLPLTSYWESTVERSQFNRLVSLPNGTYDVVIIGGGITGLTAALHLVNETAISVCVLEAGVLAWGASGRNGGFCCIGATQLNHQQLLKTFGRSAVYDYFQAQRRAITWVQQFAEQHGLDIDRQGEGEIQVAHRLSRQAELEAAWEFYSDVAKFPCQLWSQAELAERAYHSPEAFAGLHVGVGFGLNPLKYTLGLADWAQRQGAHLCTHSPVTRWETLSGWHHLHTPKGTVRAKRVIVATNGYTLDSLHPGLSDRLLPALSNIITTRPLTAAELAAQGWQTQTPIYDTRHLLFYFRLLQDGRFLFGSRGGTVGSAAENDRRQHQMTRRLGEMFPAWRSVEITHFWNGLVCLSSALTPHVGQLADDPSIFYGLAYHGGGVATGTWIGQVLARLVSDRELPSDRCAVIRQPLKRFPLGFLRPWYLRTAYAGYTLQDVL